jgi:hypothetical protein
VRRELTLTSEVAQAIRSLVEPSDAAGIRTLRAPGSLDKQGALAPDRPCRQSTATGHRRRARARASLRSPRCRARDGGNALDADAEGGEVPFSWMTRCVSSVQQLLSGPDGVGPHRMTGPAEAVGTSPAEAPAVYRSGMRTMGLRADRDRAGHVVPRLAEAGDARATGRDADEEWVVALNPSQG